MKTLGDVFHKSLAFLDEKKVFRPRSVLEALLSSVLGCNRLDLYMHFEKPLNDDELAVLRSMVLRASKHEPIEYILGKMEFFGVDLLIDSSALIPRPETELLVEMALKNLKGTEEVWDVCTGSGAIAISLKKKKAGLTVFASDISLKALELAQKNALKNNVEIQFLKGDLLGPFKGKKADMIISNPPYVSEKEYEELDLSVKNFEPKEALVAGLKGGDFYKRFAFEAHNYLDPGGRLLLEIGEAQGRLLEEIFNSPFWKGTVHRDYAGKSRFFFLERQ